MHVQAILSAYSRHRTVTLAETCFPFVTAACVNKLNLHQELHLSWMTLRCLLLPKECPLCHPSSQQVCGNSLLLSFIFWGNLAVTPISCTWLILDDPEYLSNITHRQYLWSLISYCKSPRSTNWTLTDFSSLAFDFISPFLFPFLLYVITSGSISLFSLGGFSSAPKMFFIFLTFWIPTLCCALEEN